MSDRLIVKKAHLRPMNQMLKGGLSLALLSAVALSQTFHSAKAATEKAALM